MSLQIKNMGRDSLQVGIILKNGKKTTVRVMPRTQKGISLPAGSRVDPYWLATHTSAKILVRDVPEKSTGISKSIAPSTTASGAPTASSVVQKNAATPSKKGV